MKAWAIADRKQRFLATCFEAAIPKRLHTKLLQAGYQQFLQFRGVRTCARWTAWFQKLCSRQAQCSSSLIRLVLLRETQCRLPQAGCYSTVITSAAIKAYFTMRKVRRNASAYSRTLAPDVLRRCIFLHVSPIIIVHLHLPLFCARANANCCNQSTLVVTLQDLVLGTAHVQQVAYRLLIQAISTSCRNFTLPQAS